MTKNTMWVKGSASLRMIGVEERRVLMAAGEQGLWRSCGRFRAVANRVGCDLSHEGVDSE